MPKSKNITLSLTSEHIDKLEKMGENTDKPNSELIRIFIDHFDENKEELNRIIEKYGDKD